MGEEENDLREFVNYLLAAIGAACPGVCDTTRSMIQASEVSAVSALSRHLVNEISSVDLHFTVKETALFLGNTLDLSVDGKTAATIQEKIEGWPAGMRLMSQSLKYSGDLDRLLAGLQGGFAAIVDYLMSEVLAHQPAEMAKLMAATAILDRFCAPLCDALLGLDAASGGGGLNGDEFIARLQKDNLFLMSLDMENRWFRYHHMFQKMLIDQLLAQRLSNKEIADKLCISTTTVKGHLQNIYGKLNVSKRLEAIEMSKKMGIF